MRVWSLNDGTELRTLRANSEVTAVDFNPTEPVIAAAAGKTVQIWETETGLELTALEHSSNVKAVAFNADGRLLASATDRMVTVWDTKKGEKRELKGHSGPVSGLTFCATGDRMASASEDGTVKLWDAESGSELLTLKTKGAAFSVAFSPDGHRLIAGCENMEKNHVIYVWDATPRDRAR